MSSEPISPDLAVLMTRVGIDPDGWSAAVLAHNRWLTPGIWQLTKGAQRIVLKWLSADRRPERRRTNSTGQHAWRTRDDGITGFEALSYEHQIVEYFDESLIDAPRCVGLDMSAKDAVLALSFVDGEPGEHFDTGEYADVGYAIGRSQASYLSGRELPRHPWISARLLRDYTSEKPVDYSLLNSQTAWNQPLVRDCFPANLRPAVVELHRRSGDLHQVMESLPRTLCHLDLWTKNLFRRPDGKIALLDWAFVGEGAIGEDIGNLIPDAAFDHFIPSRRLAELDDAVCAAYVRGLRHAGWSGDDRLVRLGVQASAVKYAWLTSLMLDQAAKSVQHQYGGAGEIDAEYRFRERGEALLFNARRELEALDLAHDLGLR